MKTIPYSRFKHGQRVTCEIEGKKIDDAKISIDSDGTVYVCQNVHEGSKAENKFDYLYSYSIACIGSDFPITADSSLQNLKFLQRTLDDLEEGDVIVCKYGAERKVLGICGEVYFLSLCDNFNSGPDAVTISEMKGYGYTLKQKEPANMYIRTPTEEEREIINNPILSINPDETEITYKGKTYILSK